MVNTPQVIIDLETNATIELCYGQNCVEIRTSGGDGSPSRDWEPYRPKLGGLGGTPLNAKVLWNLEDPQNILAPYGLGQDTQSEWKWKMYGLGISQSGGEPLSELAKII
jgi:hypothetical protein